MKRLKLIICCAVILGTSYAFGASTMTHTWESGVDVYFLLDGEMWIGDEIDIGAYEYNSGTPSSSGRRGGAAGMMMGW